MSGFGACACRGTQVLRGVRGVRWRSSSGDGGGVEETPLRKLLDGAAAFGEGGAGSGELEWATQPYAARPGDGGPVPAPGDGRPRADPRDAAVLLFPGQGSQFVGMGKRIMHLPAVRDLYQLASETVKWDVARVCTEGPAEELDRRCQTAVLVTSLAALQAATEARPGLLERARAAAGFSLGEIAALVTAGAIDFEPALRLTEVRAAAMAAASAEQRGGLLTVWLAADARLSAALRAARDHVRETLRDTDHHEPLAEVANYLYPNCKVIAGDEEVLQWIERSGGAFGVRRAARVAVHGAFHSRAMLPAAAVLRDALHAIEVRSPRIAVFSNVDAKPYRNPKQIKSYLVRHVTSPVRWEQTLQALYARPASNALPLSVALGPGAALRSTLRQVNARAWDCSIQQDV